MSEALFHEASARGRLPTLQLLDPLLQPAQLEDKVVAALELAREHVANLERYRPFWTDGADAPLDLADKVIVESALLAMVASRSRLERVCPVARRLADDLAPHVRTDRNRELLLRTPHVAAPLGLAHVCLELCGVHDETYSLLVRRIFESGLPYAAERLPYRSLEIRWIHSLLTGAAPRTDALVTASVVSSRLDPMAIPGPEIYAITHMILFASDFGERKLARMVRRRDLRHLLDALLAGLVASPNLDLLGELLLSRLIVGGVSPHAQFAWALLWNVWETLGFVPSPGFSSAIFAKQDGTAAAAYAFRHTYHTTFVAALLALRVLTSTNDLESAARPSARLRALLASECASTSDGVGSYDGLFADAGALERLNHIEWAVPHDRLRHVRPDRLEAAIVDGRLVRAGRNQDLGALVAGVRAAGTAGAQPTTLLEAAAFLARVQWRVRPIDDQTGDDSEVIARAGSRDHAGAHDARSGRLRDTDPTPRALRA